MDADAIAIDRIERYSTARTLSMFKLNAVAWRCHGVLKDLKDRRMAAWPRRKVSYNAVRPPQARTMVVVQTTVIRDICTGMSLQGFSMPIWGRRSALFQLNIKQILPKMIIDISNLYFGENSLKTRSKIGKQGTCLNSHLDANIQSNELRYKALHWQIVIW